MMIGDKPFIVRVRPGTDAESKVHPGDEVIAYNKFLVSRDTLWKMDYYFKRLAPQADANLVLKDPQGQQREMKVIGQGPSTQARPRLHPWRRHLADRPRTGKR